MSQAHRLVEVCRARGITVAAAESLTAGLVTATIATVPGCSSVLRGGVVAYASDVKEQVLGLDHALVEHVVSREVAEALATRVCSVLDADLGIGTTGAAGPEPLDGQPPGTAWVAVHDRRSGRTSALLLQVVGDRQTVREACVSAALEQALDLLDGLGE